MFNLAKKLFIMLITSCSVMISGSDTGNIERDCSKAREMLSGFSIEGKIEIIAPTGAKFVYVPISSIGEAAVFVVSRLPKDILADFRLNGYEGYAENPLDAMIEVLKERDELKAQVNRLDAQIALIDLAKSRPAPLIPSLSKSIAIPSILKKS